MEYSLLELLALAKENKQAAIDAATRLVVPWTRERFPLYTLKSYSDKGFTSGEPRSLPKKREFIFDHLGAVVTYLHRTYPHSYDTINETMLAGQPDAWLASIVIGRTPENILLSQAEQRRSGYEKTAFVYVECGPSRTPYVVKFLRGDALVSEAKPILYLARELDPRIAGTKGGKQMKNSLREEIEIWFPRTLLF